MLETCNIKLHEKTLKKLFVFSKMSLINDMEDIDAYNEMQFVEFLEFIGRLGLHQYEKREDLTDCGKLENILDILLNSHDLERVPLHQFN